MVAVKNCADRVVLYNVSWEQYETFLKASGDRPSARIAYDNGTLEMFRIAPS